MKRFAETPTSRPLRRWSSVSALSLLLGTALLGACAGQERAPDSEDYLAGIAITSQFGDLSTGAREVALERLEVQLEYLLNELEEDSPRQRVSLLFELYEERLRTFELLRLEEETDRQLGS